MAAVKILIALAVLIAAAAAAPHNVTVAAPTFVVNLDLPPEDRWTEIVTLYKSSAPLIVNYFTHALPKDVAEAMEKIMANLDNLLGDFGRELRGVAKAYGIDLGIIVGLNFAYELRKWGGGHSNTTGPVNASQMFSPKVCTSIVAEDATNQIFHGRNMDWNLPTDMRNLTIVADFQRNNRTVYKAATYVGFVGVFTGMAPGRYSVSVNERDIGGDPIVNALNALLNGAQSVTHVLRNLFEQAYNYQDAVTVLRTTRLTAPVYYTIAGTSKDQGAVLTRNRDFNRDDWKLPSPVSGAAWYLLQTNYDHWLPDPVHDARRTYGDNHMNAIGQRLGASLDGIFDVLSTWPVMNNNTCQSVMMQPSTGYFRAYARFFYP